jgi:thiosulfate/3-mercaptopyruvate sulfurtransferase
MFRTLIDADQLRPLLGSPECRVIDCRFDLGKPSWGGVQYWLEHIPGAIYAHLDRDLSSPITRSSGRHPLPAAETLAATLSAWGIDRRVQVVVYDQGNGMYAARLWWLMRWLGHEQVAVLDGGYAAWIADGTRPVSRDVVTLAPRVFVARPRKDWVVSSEELAGRVAAGLPSRCLFDARGADRYAGQNETIDPVAGHVPGACSTPFTGNLGADGKFLPVGALRERWATQLTDPASAVMMCGSGVSACHNLLALEHAGLGGAKLYAGSWSEWIRDPQRPVAVGSSIG